MLQRVMSRFLPIFFVSQCRKISGNISVNQKISGSEKFYASERGVSSFFAENFLSHSTEKFRQGTLRCFRKFRASLNFMHEKGISKNSVEKSLSTSADKSRWRNEKLYEGNLLFSGNFLVSKKNYE